MVLEKKYFPGPGKWQIINQFLQSFFDWGFLNKKRKRIVENNHKVYNKKLGGTVYCGNPPNCYYEARYYLANLSSNRSYCYVYRINNE